MTTLTALNEWDLTVTVVIPARSLHEAEAILDEVLGDAEDRHAGYRYLGGRQSPEQIIRQARGEA